MFSLKPYNRERARSYAEKWAFSRSPLFENYTGQGGDCTNFISQCILAGGCVMNFTRDVGWYYMSPTDRAAAWTGVSFLWRFLTGNQDVGPFGSEAEPGGLTIGDIIQLGTSPDDYYHSLLVTGYGDGTYLVAAHTNDAFDRPLSSYTYNVARFLHIEGIRIRTGNDDECYRMLLGGTAIPQNGGLYVPVPRPEENRLNQQNQTNSSNPSSQLNQSNQSNLSNQSGMSGNQSDTDNADDSE